ncbi:MAG: helix-turn-helix transcriptional regulator [Terracidiphilus sp.]|jgi:DNA-binding XRE family transcriptional regulator
MRGIIPVEDVIAVLPKAWQKSIEKRGKKLQARVARRMTLAEVRKERKVTQTKMAKKLGIGQMQISRLERRKDPRLSTMQKTVAALGGNLMLLATFPDQEPVVIVTGTERRRKAS